MIKEIIPIYPTEKFESNAYIVSDGKSAVIIDAPTTAINAAKQFIAEGGKPCAILITHGHFDHIEGLPELAELTGAPVYISKADREKLTDDTANRAVFHFPGDFPHYTGEVIELTGGERLTFGDTVIEVIAVPGHTAGCLAFIADNKYCFSGDFVFKNGIGRTDFDDSDELDMYRSLRSFMHRSENLAIYPGHGPDTTLDIERKFLRAGTDLQR
jgi:glyoxylase-like metal-dependent hydrolase (beta-lactamase superfamily II)